LFSHFRSARKLKHHKLNTTNAKNSVG